MSAEPQGLARQQSFEWHKVESGLWVAAPHPFVMYAVRAVAVKYDLYVCDLEHHDFNHIETWDTLSDAQGDAEVHWEDVKDVE